MSSPMSSISVPSQNHSHHHGSYLDQLGYGRRHFDGFNDHLSKNPSYSMPRNSMNKNYAVHRIHDSATHKSLMTEQLPIYQQAPHVQHTQPLNQGSGDQIVRLQPEQQRPAAQPQQIERQRVGEDVLVVQLERALLGLGKPRLHWTHELHARFVRKVSELGGSFSATPKGIRTKMNVKGLTLGQIKSHLQKFQTSDKRIIMHQGIQNSANSHSLQLPGQESSTSRSSAPVNGKDLESFEPDIEAYGNLLQSSEIPICYQNLMFAPVGDYQYNTNSSSFGL